MTQQYLTHNGQDLVKQSHNDSARKTYSRKKRNEKLFMLYAEREVGPATESHASLVDAALLSHHGYSSD